MPAVCDLTCDLTCELTSDLFALGSNVIHADWAEKHARARGADGHAVSAADGDPPEAHTRARRHHIIMDDDGAGDASTAGYVAAMEEMMESTAAAEAARDAVLARVAQLEALYEPARPGGRTPDVTARGRAYLMLACGNDEQHRHMHHNVWRPVLALGENKLWLPDVVLDGRGFSGGAVLDGVGRVLVEYETDHDSEHRSPMFAGTGTREAFERRTTHEIALYGLCNFWPMALTLNPGAPYPSSTAAA